MKHMQVIGLTTTEIHQGNNVFVQYLVHTQSQGRLYDYVFTPDETGKYTMRTNPTVETTSEMLPLVPTYIEWDKQTLLIIADDQYDILFDNVSKRFHPPDEYFHDENEILPTRPVLIIDGNPENILPFLDENLKYVYADSWEGLPSAIPEDVVVMDLKRFPIDSIVMRLPSRTRAIVMQSKLIK